MILALRIPRGGIVILGCVRIKSPVERSRVNACTPEPKVTEKIVADEYRT